MKTILLFWIFYTCIMLMYTCHCLLNQTGRKQRQCPTQAVPSAPSPVWNMQQNTVSPNTDIIILKKPKM